MKSLKYNSIFPEWSKSEENIIQELSQYYDIIGVCTSQYCQLNRVQRHWVDNNPSIFLGNKHSYPVFLFKKISCDLFGKEMQDLFSGSLLLCFFNNFDDGFHLSYFTEGSNFIRDFDFNQWFDRWNGLVCVIEKCYDNKQHYVQYYCKDNDVFIVDKIGKLTSSC